MSGYNKHVPLIACEDNWKQMMYSKGIFDGDNIFARSIPFHLLRMTLFFLISRSLRFILKPLKQTQFICDLLAGIILGTSVLGLFKGYSKAKDAPLQKQFLNVAAFLGLIYRIFFINVKIDGKRILKIGKKIRTIGVSTPFIGFIVMVVIVAILDPSGVRYMQFTLLFLHSCTSVLDIAPFLEELHMLTTELGQISLSAAFVTDILSTIFRVVSIFKTSLTGGFVKAILPLSAVILFTLYVVGPFMQWIVRNTPHNRPVNETYVVGILLYAGVLSATCDAIVAMPMLGVMLFGLMVPNGPPLGSAIVEMGETFVEHFLMPLFYLSMGDLVDFHAITDWKKHLMFQIITMTASVTKTFVVALLAMFYDMSHRQSITLGLLMNAVGVSHSAYIWFAWMRQNTDRYFATALVIHSIIKGVLIAPLAAYFSKHTSRMDRSIFELSIQAASTSKMRILACVDNEDGIPGIISLLEASNPTESSPIYAYVVHLTELIGEAMPMLTHHRKHRRVCKHNGCVQIMNGLKRYSVNSAGRIVLNLLTMISPFKTMHEGLCRLAQDKMISLIIIPFLYKSPAHYRQQVVSNDLNRKIQAIAPCTVGILVDRPTTMLKKNQVSYFSFKIVVFFFGGEDDREVLAFANRMSGHPGVSILMLRIMVVANKWEVEVDEQDESLLEEFRTRITDNACAVYREIQVEDLVQSIHVMHSVTAENDYDLVMVGRRHEQIKLHDQHMCALSVSPELGFIGETLFSFVSRDFSILVLQHYMGVDRDVLSSLMIMEDDVKYC